MFGACRRARWSSVSPSALSLLLGFALAACAHQPEPSTPAAASAAAEPVATATTPAPATAPGPELTKRTGASVFVVHLISDLAAFQKYFEHGAAEREAAGVEGYLLTRLDDGRVVIHLFAADAAKVQTALNSEGMQQYINRSGAPEASLVWVARDELVYLPRKPPTVATFSLYLKRRTRDFARFRQAFEQRTAFFSKQGMIGFGLHQSSTQPDIVILHFVGTNKASVEALSTQPELRELMALTEDADSVKPLIGEDFSRSRPR